MTEVEVEVGGRRFKVTKREPSTNPNPDLRRLADKIAGFTAPDGWSVQIWRRGGRHCRGGRRADHWSLMKPSGMRDKAIAKAKELI